MFIMSVSTSMNVLTNTNMSSNTSVGNAVVKLFKTVTHNSKNRGSSFVEANKLRALTLGKIFTPNCPRD